MQATQPNVVASKLVNGRVAAAQLVEGKGNDPNDIDWLTFTGDEWLNLTAHQWVEFRLAPPRPGVRFVAAQLFAAEE